MGEVDLRTKRLRRVNVTLLVLLAVFAMIVLVQTLEIERSQSTTRRALAQTTEALAVARGWKDVSVKWEDAAKRAIVAADAANETSADWRDQFQVCNSMLPRAQRMQ